jgi:hypothetical protein
VGAGRVGWGGLEDVGTSKEMAGLCSTRSGREGALRFSCSTKFPSASNSSSTCTDSFRHQEIDETQVPENFSHIEERSYSHA